MDRALAKTSTVAVVGAAALIWLALVAPLVTLLEHIDPGQLLATLGSSPLLSATEVSLGASAVALLVIVCLGTPLAWLLARGLLPMQRLWQLGVLLPLLTPPLVVGLLLVFMLGPLTPLGSLLSHWQLSATNTLLALIIAEVYESAPYYLVGAQAAFAAVDVELERNAQLLGDSPITSFRRITLPLAAPGLASALATAWARAMGAFGAVIIIAYHPFGLPLQIWVSLQETGLSSALPYALVLLAVALPLPVAAFIWSAHAQRRY